MCGLRTLRYIVMLPLLACLGEGARAQLILYPQQTPNVLVQNYLTGSGVFASGITFNGDAGNNLPPPVPAYQEGQIGRFNGANTCIDINAGVYLCSGRADAILPGPNNMLNPSSGWFYTSGFYSTPEIDLSQASRWPLWQTWNGFNIGNKSVLEFDFIPTSDMIQLRYVFSSEEYERAACTGFNDVMGMFLSGPGINGPYANNAINIALVPGSLDPVCVNSVNSGQTLANANGDPMSMDPWSICRDNYPSWPGNAQYYK